jgi:hypothetical protein
MRSSSSIVVALSLVAVVLPACYEPEPPGTQVVVMTQNLGIGADLDAVLAASTADAAAMVDAMWAEKDVSSFADRADAIAAGIALYRPQLVGLQSVIQWSRQIPASDAPAGDVAADYLHVLLAALGAHGLAYDPVSVVTTSDIELTGASGNDYRLVDREVILAARGVPIRGTAGGTYVAGRTYSVNGTVGEIRRGWASVVAEKDGKRFRFLSTRLEPVARDVQRAQSVELAKIVRGGTATILVGDLASEIELPSSPGYGILLDAASGLNDAVADAGAGFPSCCRDVLCVDPAARLERRTDFVLTTTHFLKSWGSWVNGNGSAMVKGRWPSPHAGILAGVVLPD